MKTIDVDNPPVPVLPGSSLRGALRSYYEMLTNSCMSAIDNDGLLSKRAAGFFEPGIIKYQNNQYDLYKATINRKERKHYPYGSENAKAKMEGQEVSNGNYIIKGEEGFNKRYCQILIPTNQLVKDNIDLSRLEKTIESYQLQKNGEESYKNYLKSLKKFKKNCQDGKKEQLYFPVFYRIIEGDTYYLSPACKTRETYKTDLLSIVGSYLPCGDDNNLCPACTLFGTVNGELVKSSKVRFNDLIFKGNYEQAFEDVVSLKILDSPKLGNTAFYLKRPEGAKYWTYDYYRREKKPIAKTAEPNGRGLPSPWGKVSPIGDE